MTDSDSKALGLISFQDWVLPVMETTFSQCISASNLMTTRRRAVLNISLSAHQLGQSWVKPAITDAIHLRSSPPVGWGEAVSTGIATLPPQEPAKEPAQSQEEKGTGHCQHHHKPGLWLPESLHVCHKQRCHH